MPYDECRRAVADIPPDIICGGNTAWVDACAGDSGGPLLDAASGEQVGVVSFGAECGSGELSPGMYASVSEHREWILATAEAGPAPRSAGLGPPLTLRTAWAVFGVAIVYIAVVLIVVSVGGAVR